MTDLIFLDTETTGLDPTLHEIWEIAWAINDGEVQSAILEHSLKTADPTALEMNGYFERSGWGVELPNGDSWDLVVRKILQGNTLVCANPTFDRMMMLKRWGLEPYHYRSVDIESYAMPIFGWHRPRGLKDIHIELLKLGFEIDKPDHSAAKDVEVLRQCYRALQRIRDEWRGNFR